jgi:hypothetical protein
MVDVLTWTIERRMRLTERAELRRLEAAEVVFGQWAEATDGGRRPSGIVEPEPEPERVAAGPGAGGMRLVPDRVEGMGLASLTSESSAEHGERTSGSARAIRGMGGRVVLAKTIGARLAPLMG